MSAPATALASLAEIQDQLAKIADRLAEIERAGGVHPRHLLTAARVHLFESRSSLFRLEK